MDKMTRLTVSHIRQNADGSLDYRPLEEHLRNVSTLAAEFAVVFGASDWARQAGIWHDLGKFSDAFQKYLYKNADPTAHIEGAPGRVNHSSAGALYALEKLGPMGNVLAYLIAGHHAGLPDYESADSGRSALKPRLQQGTHDGLLEQALTADIPADILEIRQPVSPPTGSPHLWIRMLFSCLVDADFLDTERFMNETRGEARRGFPQIGELRLALDRHMTELMSDAESTDLNKLRTDIYHQCCNHAKDDWPLRSLTVPTGGGKTLASLAFALRHAEANGKRRVIYAIPYTSIIEQTADVFRNALGKYADALVEHHSNAEADPDKENHKTRLACENWDAPLIVTTNVQLFESLFAARTSRCRKLHNIVHSVIVLDEAQTLPLNFLQPIINVMRGLAEHYGVSFVFCTATQPELGSRRGFDSLFKGLDGIREIMDDVPGLYRQLKRVNVQLPPDLHTPTDWESLADELADLDRSVLCIVNRRDDCRELYDLLKRRSDEDVYHLSALMCGQHRSEVIGEIKQRLKDGDIIKVVSTQLVEAGVDLDFPVVYRALAGLDSIAQAAGRCNREGKIKEGGDVQVFVPPTEPPPGLLRIAAHKTRQTLHGVKDDPLTPALFKKFFTNFYSDAETDRHGIENLLRLQGTNISFRTAAQRFRLIEDEHSEAVFVKFGKGEKLLTTLLSCGPERRLMRKLQRYTVNLPKREMERLRGESRVDEVYPGVFIQIDDTLYDDEVGLIVGTTPPNPANLIVSD